MVELLRTTDIVLVSYVNSLLDEAGIPSLVADVHMSVMEGSIGVFPRRVLVAAADWHDGAAILADAGLSEYISDLAN
jgi:hypothetical protein